MKKGIRLANFTQNLLKFPMKMKNMYFGSRGGSIKPLDPPLNPPLNDGSNSYWMVIVTCLGPVSCVLH